MGGVAALARAAGHRVTGSDQNVYPPMSTQLAALGIELIEGYGPEQLDLRPDVVVVGNVMRRGVPVIEALLDRGLPYVSGPEWLARELLRERWVLAVAGTHGKTTTTSMLSWILAHAGREPGFLIGGVPANFGVSARLGGSAFFVIEADEYDTAFFDKGPKFLHYFPDALILTHVEFDHADIYADLDAVKTAFMRLVNLVPRRGRIVAYDASENVSQCVARAFCSVERYGFSADAHWHIAECTTQDDRSLWQIHRNGKAWAEFSMPVVGEHNVLNATAAAALAAGQGIPLAAIQKALASFRSVKRRLEVCAEVNGITIIDDFAHHPTAIRETLRALRARYPGRRLWAVLEPRSNTLRRNVFQKELVESLTVADRVILAQVYQQEKIPVEQRLHVERVIGDLQQRQHAAVSLPDVDAIVAHLAAHAQSGDVVALLSNGGFGDIYRKLPERLQSMSQSGAQR